MTRIEGEVDIAAPVDQVFDLVADERNEPRYNPRLARAEKVTDGPVGAGSRFVVEPRGMGRWGVMTAEVVDYDRPRRLATSVRSSYLAVDGTLTFTEADGGTRLSWSWDTRLRGWARLFTPVLVVTGARWERRNWEDLKRFMEG
jgi:uncharacterized protein YndB with AHSA1/START domain